eukprot:334681_1
MRREGERGFFLFSAACNMWRCLVFRETSSLSFVTKVLSYKFFLFCVWGIYKSLWFGSVVCVVSLSHRKNRIIDSSGEHLHEGQLAGHVEAASGLEGVAALHAGRMHGVEADAVAALLPGRGRALVVEHDIGIGGAVLEG